jgi:hypothetical protein
VADPDLSNTVGPWLKPGNEVRRQAPFGWTPPVTLSARFGLPGIKGSYDRDAER